MNVRLIRESGVKPWGAVKQVENDQLATLSLIAIKKEELTACLFSVMLIVGKLYGFIYRWHSLLLPFVGNKVQKLKLKKELLADVAGFSDTCVIESSFGIWANVSKLTLPFSKKHFEYLNDGDRTYVILSNGRFKTCEDVIAAMEEYQSGFNAVEIAEFFNKFPEVVVGYAYEDEDTHSAFQFMGGRKYIDQIAEAISDVDIVKLNRDKVAGYLSLSEI